MSIEYESEGGHPIEQAMAESLALPMMLPGRTIQGVEDLGRAFIGSNARRVNVTLDNGVVLVAIIEAAVSPHEIKRITDRIDKMQEAYKDGEWKELNA